MFVRKDISITHQMVQAAHGALEAGKAFPVATSEPSSLLVLQVKDLNELEKARRHISDCGIKTEIFFEPSWDYGNTSFGTEPILNEQRHFLKGYQLWKP